MGPAGPAVGLVGPAWGFGSAAGPVGAAPGAGPGPEPPPGPGPAGSPGGSCLPLSCVICGVLPEGRPGG
ncbi:hypothetical protein CP974_06295 [Streptomyces fradiae ATCC 10745 = DSM 40063]|nr:hypothetical protein CP974_06295 [Streptomyces fradiae ATCC 10745 = DSM 40063]